MDRRAMLFLHGYTIFGGFADPVFSLEPIWKAAGMREGFSGMKTSAPCEIVS